MENKLRKMKKAVAVTLAVVMSLISAGMAALAEDAPAKATDDRVMSEEVKSQLKAAADEFPEKLDLRDYDTLPHRRDRCRHDKPESRR